MGTGEQLSDIKADEKLWNEFRDGSENAYNQIINSYSKLMFNYAFRLCQEKDLVKDSLQDVFVQLWNSRANLGEAKSIKHYLLKSIRSQIFRELPKWNQHKELLEEYIFHIEFDIEYAQIKYVEQQEIALRIKRTLDLLPARQREVLYLKYYENMSSDEISEVMSITIQSVYNLSQKAFKTFRAEWLYAVIPLKALLIYIINSQAIKK